MYKVNDELRVMNNGLFKNLENSISNVIRYSLFIIQEQPNVWAPIQSPRIIR